MLSRGPRGRLWPMPATCAWCGGSPVTREHLLPHWLGKVLQDWSPSDDGYDFAYVYSTEAGEGTPRTYVVGRPEIVVKAVCEDCNGGWMSQLEREVIPFLGPMVRGEEVHLDVAAQVVLARWAAKVAVLLDEYERGAVVLAEGDMDTVFREGVAPSGFHVRLAYRAEDEPAPFDFYLSNHYAAPAGQLDQDVADASEANTFSVTMGIGRVAISVIGGPGIDNPERWREGSDFPLMIWPPTVPGIDWPPANPRLPLRDGLREFHESFWTRISNPGFPRPDALRHVQPPD